MYADFIEDRLAENSEHIALLKKGIKNFTPTWLESNFRQAIKYETLQPVDSFFENLYQQYDDNEKLFIYKSIYSQAGFKEAIENLQLFVEGLKIDITEGSINYTPYMLFDKVSDTEYTNSDCTAPSGYEGSPVYQVKLQSIDEDWHNLPYDWNLTEWTDYTDYSIDSGPSTASPTYKYVKFGESPYLNSILDDGDEFSMTYQILSSTRTVTAIVDFYSSETSIDLISNGHIYDWKLVKDTTASSDEPLWMLQYQYNNLRKIKEFKYRNTSEQISFTYAGNSTISMTGSSSSVLSSQIAYRKDNKYAFFMNPVVNIPTTAGGSSYRQFPEQESATATPVYNITVSTTHEIFKDNELFQSRFEYLIKELLYYYGDTIEPLYYITYEVNALNKEQHSITLTPRRYNWFEITDPNNP